MTSGASTRTGGWPGSPPALFILSVATLAVSLVLFTALVTGAACGSGGGGDPFTAISIGTATATPSPDAPTATSTATPSPTAAPTTPAGRAETPAPNGEDTSPQVACTLLAPVDQTRRVARDCTLGGGGLTAETAAAFERMRAEAAKEGLTLVIISGYRGFDSQKQIYDGDVAAFGPNQNVSAKPGHSEHQLGTTVDINEIAESFGETAEGKWLAKNSVKFGFVMSYPPGREAQTGYAYEPWHFRYIGKAEASAVKASGLTLHEYLLKR